MSVSISDFWRLLAESRLVGQEQAQRLAIEFGQLKQTAKSAAAPTAKTVAQWLISRNILSRYQAMILLGGRAGPFYYGDYKVYDRIEQGCLAGCFRAVHAASGHPVLLRFLTGEVISDSQLWAATQLQVQAASHIVSPHVQRYFEAVDLHNFKFVVSEDLRGNTLDERLTSGRLPPAEACRLARLAVLGLMQMHARNRVHGDIRPASLLLEPIANQPANIKLLFDARQTPQPLDLTDQRSGGRLEAMADYLAPELMTPGRPPDPLTDIYALGCTLYSMLAGAPPFAGGSLQQKLSRHASEPIRPLETWGVPQPIGQLVAYMMAKNPAVRYQSATLVAEQLAIFVEPAALRALPVATPPTLAAYEQYLRQKQTQLSPATTPLPFQTDRDRFAAIAVAARVATVAPSPAVAAPLVAVNVAPKGRSSGRTADEILRRRRAERKRNLIIGLATGTMIAIAALVGGGIWWSKQNATGPAVAANDKPSGNEEAGKAPPLTPASTSGTRPTAEEGSASAAGGSGSVTSVAKVAASADGAPSPQVVADDGKTLWASPTSGKPVSFRCVPPEGQVFLTLRPAALLSTSEGARVIAALGPAFAKQREAFESASGFKLEEVEQLQLTLHNNEAKFPRASFVVKTNQAFAREQLLERWNNPAATKEQAETYYTGPAWAYYIPHAPNDERTFAMGEPRDIKDVAAAAGAPPPVFREIERLRRTTDADRHLTLLFYPQFLFNDDGEPLFTAERAKLRQPLAWLLGDNLQAACISANISDDLYVEMRMLASLDKEPYQLAQELRERLEKTPGSLEDYFVSLSPPPYWKKLAFRYPGMVRELCAHIRTGVENEQAVVNSVLPAAAAHNLVLGGELLVATTPGPTTAVVTAPAASGTKTIADALQIKTSYSFDNQSLEFAMRDLAEDVQSNLKGAPFEFAIKIIGDDLKIDGITRNQSIRDFKQENQTVADILTALVRKANPVTTVKDPSEKDQKLIWVIGPDPDSPAKQAVLITTRAAAASKKYTLPTVFVGKKT